MTLEMLADFLGWMLVMNIAILLVTSLLMLVFKNMFASLHAKLFQLDRDFVMQYYFKFIGNYKLLVLVFNLAPYLALRWLS